MATAPEGLDSTATDELRASSRLPPWLPRLLLMIIAYVVGAFLLLQMLARVRGLLFMIVVSLFLSFAIEPAVNFLAQRGGGAGPPPG